MSGTVLITRPLAQAEEMAESVQAMGVGVLVEPMLELRGVEYEAPVLENIDGLIITSANALRFWDYEGVDKAMPVYVVGAQTAAAVQAHGFSDVRGLELRPAAGKYLHVRGVHTARKMMGDVTDLIVYEAVPAEALSAECAAAIRGHEIEFIMFYSARTAQNFMRLATEAGLGAALESIKALSISAGVLECVRTQSWKAMYVSDVPDGDGMMNLFREVMSDEREHEKDY